MSLTSPEHEQGLPSAPPPGSAVLRDVAVVVLLFAAAAVVAGLVWPHLVTPVQVTRTDVGLSTGEVALSERFDNDGWYAVLAGGLGLALGATTAAWRRSNELVTVLAVTGAAFLAAWLMARVGTWAGPADPASVLADAKVGASAPDRVTVSAQAAYFVWPIAAVTGSLLVLWSPAGEPWLRRRPRRDRG